MLTAFPGDLFRAEYPVARIPETGNNISVVIQVLIQCSTVNLHVGMSLRQGLQPLRSRNNAHEFDGFRLALFNLRNRVHR